MSRTCEIGRRIAVTEISESINTYMNQSHNRYLPWMHRIVDDGVATRFRISGGLRMRRDGTSAMAEGFAR
jgi:predicted phosphoribosyltransferase